MPEAREWPENMKSKYVVFAVAILLALTSSPAFAAGGVIENPKQMPLTGPMLDQVNYQYYGGASYLTEISPAHAIMGAELSLTVAQYQGFAADSSLTVGTTPGYNDQGVYFNNLRAVVNNSNFRIAMYYMSNYTYFQDVMLSGVEGTATPTTFPCSLYASSCKNFKGGPAENMYGPTNLLNAIKYLLKTQSDPNPIDRLYEGNTTDITCPANPAVNGCPSLTWHQGSATGPVYAPNWVGRGSLHRHDFAVEIQSTAAKIGFTFTYTEFAAHSTSGKYVESVSAASVTKDGVYNPKTGYNSAPVYNYQRASPTTCASGISTSEDCWDLYSYGYGVSGATSGLFSGAEQLNSAYGSSSANPGLYYNKAMDLATNKAIYAKTVSAATAALGNIGLLEMQQLPFLNIYFSNTLWVVLTNGWTGYTDVPTLGPGSLGGLFYSLLSQHASCFPTSCKSGGTMTFGLESTLDTPGGPTPMANFNTVYDADLTNQIYETPVTTCPYQYTSAGAYCNWMLSANGKPSVNQPSTFTIKTKPFTGVTGSGAGWTDYQKNTTDTTLSSAAQNIYKGQEFILTFAPNIYFSDGVQATAADYNFSLYVSDLANSPTLYSVTTPLTGGLAGPSGLIASYLPPSKPLEIDLYVNSTTILNPITIGEVPTLPYHIFKYFNVNNAWALSNTFDTSFNYNGTILSSNGCVSCVNTHAGPVPAWLRALPNLEVGTGPWILRSWDGVGQTGELLRNVNYYRSNWSMNDTNNQVTKGSTFTFSQPVYEWSYDPVACASSADFICKVPITSAITATLQLVNSKTGANVGKPIALTCTGGVCSGSISSKTFKIGDNELVFSATFTYLGLARTFNVYTGVLVHT